MLLYTIEQLQMISSNDKTMIVIYFLSVILAVSVIIVKSPVVSILNLIGLFCSIAVYLVKWSLVFPGLTYLLVYVGAISILFIFIVMLLNVRISELSTETKNSTVLGILSVISILFLFSIIIPELDAYPYVYSFINSLNEFISLLSINLFKTTTADVLSSQNAEIIIASVSIKDWDSSIAETSHISSIGNILYTVLLLELLILGFILLLAMVGAIIITVKSVNVSYQEKYDNDLKFLLKSATLPESNDDKNTDISDSNSSDSSKLSRPELDNVIIDIRQYTKNDYNAASSSESSSNASSPTGFEGRTPQEKAADLSTLENYKRYLHEVEKEIPEYQNRDIKALRNNLSKTQGEDYYDSVKDKRAGFYAHNSSVIVPRDPDNHSEDAETPTLSEVEGTVQHVQKSRFVIKERVETWRRDEPWEGFSDSESSWSGIKSSDPADNTDVNSKKRDRSSSDDETENPKKLKTSNVQDQDKNQDQDSEGPTNLARNTDTNRDIYDNNLNNINNLGFKFNDIELSNIISNYILILFASLNIFGLNIFGFNWMTLLLYLIPILIAIKKRRFTGNTFIKLYKLIKLFIN